MVLLGVKTIDDVIWKKYAPKSPKGGVNGPFGGLGRLITLLEFIPKLLQTVSATEASLLLDRRVWNALPPELRHDISFGLFRR